MKEISFFISLQGKDLREIFQNENLKKSLPKDLMEVNISVAGDFIKVNALLKDEQQIHFPLYGSDSPSKG